jgi:hypothetical protein
MARTPLLSAALSLALLAPAVAEDDAIRAAVEDVLHGEDVSTREAARERLLQGGEEAVRALLEALEDLGAARRLDVPGPASWGEVARRPAPGADADDGEHVLQLYDVKDLAARMGGMDELVARLRRLVGADGSVQPHDGVLVVKAARSDHGAVAQRLDVLRRDSSVLVRLETRVVEAPLSAALGREVSAARPGQIVAVADAAEAVARWLKAGEAKVVTAPALSCFPGQTASVHAGSEVSFVADFDVEVSQSAFIADPIVDTIYEGVMVELRPHLLEGGVRLDLHATYTDVELESFTTHLGRQEYEIQIPAVARSEVRRTVDVTDGQTVLLRIADDAERRRFVLVTVTREPLEDE